MPRFGDETAGGDTFPCSGDRALLSLFTLTETADIVSIEARFHSSSTAGTNFKGLIYSNNAGVPDARLGVGSAVAVPAGGGVLSSALALAGLPPGDYWLGYVCDSFQAVAEEDPSGGLSRMEGATYASPAATWTESGTGSGRINVYAEYTTPGKPTPYYHQLAAALASQ